MLVLFSQPFSRHFHAPLCSTATFILTIYHVLWIIVPYIIAYSTRSFWLKENTYRVQPQVSFKHELILLVEGIIEGTSPIETFSYVYGTYPGYNNFYKSNVRVPLIKTSEIDINRDSLNDYMRFEISMPVFKNESVYRTRVAFVYDYQIPDFPLIMESLGILDLSTPIPGSQVSVDGELLFIQNELLQMGTIRNKYNVACLNFTNPWDYNMYNWSWETLIENYMERNEKTELKVNYPIWKTEGSAEDFKITGKIRYNKQLIHYRPSLLEVLKNAWIQYLAFYILLGILLKPFKAFIFENQVIRTRMTVDRVPGESSHKLHQF
ncbi:hypothetical protein BCR32DRAFT_268989 [Anaeromyces robustus]|uniref:Transmembrane protein 231 n=1 Tax=Anaeromyces robustus TaxID=1754192 RepID=A0A1Y1X3D9_9FUNG|nr:hypothetical protein BCR32DRAFT_268989 [Anaeromyces robustus]|eukprot:ORX80212.1 hypothetical protein BCR32DRAFT_268989 [Anaeromyces robustus]